MRSEKKRNGLSSVVFGLIILSSLAAWPAWAKTTPNATIQVTNTNDSGPGSLRDAIANASSGDTIGFSLSASPATITLSSVLSINTSLIINGPGASILAISGNNSVEVFQIASGATVSISGVTIENGYGGALDGSAAVANSGTLTLANSTLSASYTFDPRGSSAIANSGMMTLNNVTVSGNSVLYGGSAVGNSGTMTLANSRVTGNGSTGINNLSGTLTLVNSTVSGNFTSETIGGGITNSSHSGQVMLIKSTVSSNASFYSGGGISSDGPLTLINSTVAENVAFYSGGGISGQAILINSTVAGNVANYSSGGIEGSVILKNTILANNAAGKLPLQGNCGSGSALSYGYNVSDDDSCSLSGPGDLNNTPAGLDPAGTKDNGGPTQTIALLPTSPAVDAIPLSSCTALDGTPVATDQRGLPRPQGSACDIGAFEYLAITGPAPTSGSTCNGAYNGTFNGNLTISPGQNCVFFNGGVTGNVQQYGGSFVLFQSQAGKNIQVNGGGTFSIGPSSAINGNLDVQNLPGGSVQNQVCGTTVSGNVNVQNNGTPVLMGANVPNGCIGNTVRGNVQVQNNWAPSSVIGNTVGGNLSDQNNSAATQLFNNTVSGNLNCQNDTVIQGGGNTVGKQKQGQCAAF